jgi:hypothetical protein
MHHTCWRYKHGCVRPSEEHPCYYCGFDIPLSTKECPECGVMICPSCGKCNCNVPLISRLTVHQIHSKYCMHLDKWKPGFRITLDGIIDNDVVKNFHKILNRCYIYEREQGNIQRYKHGR